MPLHGFRPSFLKVHLIVRESMWDHEYRGYYPVLVVIRQLLRSNEVMHLPVTEVETAAERLVLVDQCPMLRKYVLQLIVFMETLWVVEGRRCVINWKLHSTRLALGDSGKPRAPGLVAGQLPDQMVHGAPKVVHGVAGDESPVADHRFRRRSRCSKDTLASFWIKFEAHRYPDKWGDHRIALRIVDPPGFVVKDLAMPPKSGW